MELAHFPIFPFKWPLSHLRLTLMWGFPTLAYVAGSVSTQSSPTTPHAAQSTPLPFPQQNWFNPPHLTSRSSLTGRTCGFLFRNWFFFRHNCPIVSRMRRLLRPCHFPSNIWIRTFCFSFYTLFWFWHNYPKRLHMLPHRSNSICTHSTTYPPNHEHTNHLHF